MVCWIVVSCVLRCSSCRLSTGGCVAGPDCGNGVVDVGESCDGVNFDGIGGGCSEYSLFWWWCVNLYV